MQIMISKCTLIIREAKVNKFVVDCLLAGLYSGV